MLARLGAGLGANYRKLWPSSAIANLADGVFFTLDALEAAQPPAQPSAAPSG